MTLSKLVSLLGVVASIEDPNPFQTPRVLFAPEHKVPKVEHAAKKRHPLVQGQSTEKCFFQDDSTFWCFSGVSPILKSGWDFSQDTGGDYWTIQLKPYVKTQGQITSTFSVDQLIESTVILDLPEFTTSVNYAIMLENTGKICMGLGWTGGPIAVDLTYNYVVWNCYKVMLDNMGSLIGTWRGVDAKWIDACESSSSSDIQVKTWELSSE